MFNPFIKRSSSIRFTGVWFGAWSYWSLARFGLVLSVRYRTLFARFRSEQNSNEGGDFLQILL